MIAFLASRGSVLQEHPDPVSLSRYVLSDYARNGMEEVRVRWNDLARTSLVRADTGNANAGDAAWGIVQDDGVSNVKVAGWDPAAKPADLLPYSLHQALPFLMGHQPKRILVLFAGVGRDMVELDCLAAGHGGHHGRRAEPRRRRPGPGSAAGAPEPAGVSRRARTRTSSCARGATSSTTTAGATTFCSWQRTDRPTTPAPATRGSTSRPTRPWRPTSTTWPPAPTR